MHHGWCFARATGSAAPSPRPAKWRPNQSGHIYLVTNNNGQRLITVSRPTITGEMYGILMTLLAGRGSLLTPIAAPIAFVPLKAIETPTFGRIPRSEPNHALYRAHLQRTLDEPFAIFPG